MPVVVEPSWVGRRITIRRAIGAAEDGRPLFADTVGELLATDGRTARVDTKAGPVDIPLSDIAIAKPAPPSTRDELALEEIAARGWQPEQTEHLGGWLLRAAGGFTGRANSVLPLGSPGVPLDDAIATARAWYAERALPLIVAVPTEARRLLDATLAEQGWAADPMVHVMVRRLDAPELPRPARPVLLEEAPGDDWLALYRDRAATPHGRALLSRHDRVRFAEIRDGGTLLAIGRGVVDDGWLGISAVHVRDDARRGGLGSAITLALAEWAGASGATRAYLQVTADNTPAVGLYETLGFWVHHDYHYRHDPHARPAA